MLLFGGSLWLSRQTPIDFAAPPAIAAASAMLGGWWLALFLASGSRDSRALRVAVPAGALVLRLLFLLSADPRLSDDIHRYVWEGGLLAEGVDPCAAAPDSPSLAVYQERWRSTFVQVNHPEVSAAYPPLTLLVQAALVRMAGGPAQPERARLALRAFFALCDLAVGALLGWILTQCGLPSCRAVAWAWNPWVALESAGSGHFEFLAILGLIAGLACFASAPVPSERGPAWGLGFLAGGAAVQLLPAALIPFALRRVARPLRGLLVIAAVLLLPLLAYRACTGAWPVPAGLNDYALRWESGSLAYRWIERLVRDSATELSWRRLSRALVIAAWGALAFACWWKRVDPLRSAAILTAGFLLLTPTLHPWYLCWLVPFLALWPWLSGVALASMAPLLYLPLAGWRTEQVWREPPWLWPCMAGALGLFLVLDFRRLRRALRHEAG